MTEPRINWRAVLDHGMVRLVDWMGNDLSIVRAARVSYSKMFATVDLHNLFHFLRLRLQEHSQYEIRVYAEAMLDLIRPIVPIAVAAFEETLK